MPRTSAPPPGRGRDGLMALRLAATAAPGDPDLAADLAGFEERHGFRVTDSRVDADTLQYLHHQAHEHCFIANSVKTEVVIEAQ